MRKIRQKRIRKVYGDMIGGKICGNLKIVDQARIYDVTYLLVDDGNEYMVYQISGITNFVKLSPKRLRKLRKYLSNCHNWNRHSYVPIDSNGELIQPNVEGKFLRRKPFMSVSVKS